MADRDQDDGNGGGRDDGPSLFDLPLEPEPRRRRRPREDDRLRTDRGEGDGGGRSGPGDEGTSPERRPGPDGRPGPEERLQERPEERPQGSPEEPGRPRRGRPELPLFGGEDAAPSPAEPPPAGGRPAPEASPPEPALETDDDRWETAAGSGTIPEHGTGGPDPGDGGTERDGRLDLEAESRAEPPVQPAPPRRPRPAPFLHRLGAALLDGGLLVVAAAAAIVGSYLLGVRWGGDDLPALALFLLVFSFAYSVVPLAFWGRTPGMALAGIVSRGADGGPLTFGQTAVRWLAGLLTLALAGLPLLLALGPLGARSLADRLSGSRTWLPPGS